LFSDGEPTDGRKTKTDLQELIRSERQKILDRDAQNNTNTVVFVNSFGIGASFNEDLMQAISVTGFGQYYFIKPQTKIMEEVDNCMQSIIDMAGVDPVLTMEVNNHYKERVKIKKIYGQAAFVRENGLFLSTIRVEEKTQVLALVEFKASKEKIEELKNVLNFRLEFKPLKILPEKTLENHLPIKILEAKDASKNQLGKAGIEISFSVSLHSGLGHAPKVNNSVALFNAFQESTEIDAQMVELMKSTSVETLQKVVKNKHLALLKLVEVVDKDDSGLVTEGLVDGIEMFRGLIAKANDAEWQAEAGRIRKAIEEELGKKQKYVYDTRVSYDECSKAAHYQAYKQQMWSKKKKMKGKK